MLFASGQVTKENTLASRGEKKNGDDTLTAFVGAL
jgi:hypothetical protein